MIQKFKAETVIFDHFAIENGTKNFLPLSDWVIFDTTAFERLSNAILFGKIC